VIRDGRGLVAQRLREPRRAAGIGGVVHRGLADGYDIDPGRIERGRGRDGVILQLQRPARS
jgi:hypothetical protein